MKNIYMLQTNIRYPNGTYLPYASGTIAAYALSDPDIGREFRLKEIFCIRESPRTIIGSLEDPAVFAFSCYVWNTEFNCEIARLVRERYPDCVTIFGGHNISDASDEFLRKNSFADFTIFGEGERPFRDILLALIGKKRFGEISNIAYRENGSILLTPKAEPGAVTDYPSPYKMGLFDGILQKYPDTDFSAILETNRGCPYHCAFCDWCSQKAKLRSFPHERIEADIRWMAEHKIEFCYCADANFGIYKKDEDLIDYLIENKKKYGYPKKFRVNYAKFNNDTVFNITKKLESAGLNKGATISFQSMTPETLKNIGRKNMSVDRFSELMRRYQDADISTYTEIILGLPGESFDDFCRGIGRLLEAGQHTTLFIYNCELIENSTMATPAYIKKYSIRSVRTPLYLRHNDSSPDDGIQEHARCVIGTDKMDTADWIRANMFSVLVQSCHSMGLLRFFALYLFHNKHIRYEEFYKALQKFAESNPDTVIGGVYAGIESRFRMITAGNGSWSYCIPEAGSVSWPYEEAFYILILLKKNRFYTEIRDFLCQFDIDKTAAEDILRYQEIIVKEPGRASAEGSFLYDLAPYFALLMAGKDAVLRKRRNSMIFYDEKIPADTAEFMRVCVWFGRSSQNNLFDDATIDYGAQT